ncbi:hypothetical protein ACFL2B_00495 [Patescibacteria group bacterium]
MKDFILVTILIFAVVAVGVIVSNQGKIASVNFGQNQLKAQGSELLGNLEADKPAVAESDIDQDVYRFWPTFGSQEYGFTLRYPRNLQVNAKASELLRDQESCQVVQFIKPGDREVRGTSIVVDAEPAGESTLDQAADRFSERGSVLSRQEITVDGVRALRLTVSTPLEADEKLREYYVLIKKEGNILSLSSVGHENLDLFEQILETVNFTF